MTPIEFKNKYYPFALLVEKSDNVPALFSIAQSALETGWGDTIVGNMMFGVKSNNPNDERQLITTTEYHDRPDVKYPAVIAVTEIIKGKRWKYKVKDWFRKYPSPEESFRDHARFLKANKRYANAFNFSTAPALFAKEVCKAGYATAPNYYDSIVSIMQRIAKLP